MEIDFNKVEYGEGHGNINSFFKNIYYDKRYIGRTYYKNSFFESKEITYIYFCGDSWLEKNQIDLLKKNDCFKDDSAECQEKDYPWCKKFIDNEDGAIVWFGKIIDKLKIDFCYFYPQEKFLI